MFNPSPWGEPVSSFREPVPVPTTDPTSGAQVLIQTSYEWMPYILGALKQLVQMWTWDSSTPSVVELAQYRAMNLLSQIGGGGIGPQVRWDTGTSAIQISIDGGATWKAAPALDPRNQTTIPPQTGAGSQCNSAVSAVAFIKTFFDDTIAALTAGALFSDIAGILIGLLLELGPFGILIDIAIILAVDFVSEGASGLTATLTTTVYDKLKCIINCRLNSNNQLTVDAFAGVQSDITTIIGGTPATMLNLVLSIMGVGGLNNAMAKAYATGTCGGCASCHWCETFDFSLSAQGWSPLAGNQAHYLTGSGWGTVDIVTGSSWGRVINILLTFPQAGTVTDVDMYFSYSPGSYLAGTTRLSLSDQGGAFQQQTTNPATGNDHYIWSGSRSMTRMGAVVVASNASSPVYSGSALIMRITLRGTGTNPFGSNNC